MQLGRRVRAWATVTAIGTATAIAAGSCGDDNKDGGGTGAGTVTVADVAQRMLGCGFTGAPELNTLLEADFTLTRNIADGIVYPKALKTYYDRLAGAYLACMMTASCEELAQTYCAEELTSGPLLSCFQKAEEDNVEPGAGFKCANGTKLDDPDEVCDGFDGCGDGSDETSKACAGTAHIACGKVSGSPESLCTGERDCTDGSDEANCFTCTSGAVLRPSARCDGFPSCEEGEDEAGCTSPGCPPGAVTAITARSASSNRALRAALSALSRAR